MWQVMLMDSTSTQGSDLLSALPRMTEEEFIPEISALAIDANGRLIPKKRKSQYIVTFDYRDRRISARFSGGSKEPIRMELGCRLQRLPYSCEGLKNRQGVVRKVYRAQSMRLGQMAVTHHQWLYLRDTIRVPATKLTARWLVTQLTLGAVIMGPIIDLFATPDPIA
jgi:hypothetical protein